MIIIVTNKLRLNWSIMDSELLENEFSPCDGCDWLYKLTNECKKPRDIDCPKNVRRPQQEYAKE